MAKSDKVYKRRDMNFNRVDLNIKQQKNAQNRTTAIHYKRQEKSNLIFKEENFFNSMDIDSFGKYLA